jgi:exopolysaccharide biosynthesis polyprenyl glycosylphosphotransferase
MIQAPRRSPSEARYLVARPHRTPGGPLIRGLYVGLLLLGDVTSIAVAFIAANQLRVALEPRPTQAGPLSDYLWTLTFLIGSIVVTFALSHLYLPRRGGSLVDRAAAIFRAVTVGTVVALALSAFSLRGLDMPRNMLVSGWALSIGFIWLARTVVDTLLKLARRARLDTERVLIIGAGDEGHTVLGKIRSAPELGYIVDGFVDDRRPMARPLVPMLGTIDDLPELLEATGARQVIVAHPSLSHTQILDIVAMCDSARVGVQVFPDVFHLVVREVDVSELSGLPMLRVRDVSLRGWNLRVKRAMDVVLSAALLILLSPILMLVAALVKITSPGPAFYIQERVGIDGRPFPCVKFRSMRTDAEADGVARMATPDDDRTTPIGRFLRRYSIDELPQLVNVLVGDMSLVGPRPERPYFVEQFSRLIPRYEKRHQEKAGVTGWAQVNGLRGQSSIQERTFYDLFYVEHWSPAFDLKILLKTVAAVIRGRNAY